MLQTLIFKYYVKHFIMSLSWGYEDIRSMKEKNTMKQLKRFIYIIKRKWKHKKEKKEIEK